jgi:cell division protein FtsB
MYRKYFHNKYFYTGLVFLVWMIFFDQENFIEQYHLTKTLNDLDSKKEFYQEEIAQNEEKIKLLETDAEYLEKFAREKYFMKKENEDVFVIIRE